MEEDFAGKISIRNSVLSTAIGTSDSHEQKLIKNIFDIFLNITGTWVGNKLATGRQREQPLRKNKHEMCDKIFYTLLFIKRKRLTQNGKLRFDLAI